MKRNNWAVEAFIAGMLLGALLLLSECAMADWVTEFGMGYKIPATTSQVLWPECRKVTVTDASLPRGIGNDASCGGDNPIFIGWPIAWQSDFDHEVWIVRAGWFHFSHWFDGGNYFHGGDEAETHMDVAALTVTFNWTAWRRKRE